MKRASFQQSVHDFVEANGLEVAAEYRVLDLVSEAGELAKEILAATEYGREEFQVTPEWQQELGDVFFALVCLADGTGVNLETALEDAVRRYAQRLEATGSASSSRDGDEDDELP